MVRRAPTPVTGSRVPTAVAQKQPAVILAPPPGTITGPLPPTPSSPGRHPFRGTPGPRPKHPPRPIRGKKPVPIGLIGLALGFLGLFVIAMGIGAAFGLHLPAGKPGPTTPPPTAFPVMEPSRPQQITIPAIAVKAPIVDVGYAADGSVGVPPLQNHNEAGWFDAGPTPGQYGPALIVGHVDTRTGPSVFHDLSKMKAGERIEVLRADGSTAVFLTNDVKHYNKGNLPLQRVYGDYSRPGLRLMTCGGQWLGSAKGYSDNWVVFASLVSTS